MAPGDEYTAGGGGKLKLKGSKVSDGRVEKKKKKSKKSKSDKEGEADTAPPEARHPDEDGGSEDHHRDRHTPPDDAGAVVGKTEAERKYEEARKKRLLDRLKREGVKTHKERVEELNKYLSRLTWAKALNVVENHMTPDHFELPLAQAAGFAGALCGLSYERSYLSCLTTAYPRLKANGKIPEINEFGIDCTTSYLYDTQAVRRQQVRAV
ncbi:DUF1754 domain-containing protein [Aspergillus thermomutatus]|uniref:Uncharacterized protein n=1 Tax=Aspergillus thermomutatus TaxID=41047 RepID=A0A397H957_ASPTH|nr:uncharacterized protein CDV56_108297 [Aspergillus thermomutatus]RHZ59601.1 hypothetical protein CDV56_108297 [Aspergillus thermomutatus]